MMLQLESVYEKKYIAIQVHLYICKGYITEIIVSSGICKVMDSDKYIFLPF